MNTVQGESAPLVSIVIPVFKVEEYIQPCMESVVAQSYPHLEVILVDDCGEDNSIALAEEVLTHSTLPWKVLCHKRNRGLSAARNTGTAVAKGAYLFFLDSDDYLSPKAIELMVNKALSSQADMVYGHIMYDTEGSIAKGFWALRCPDSPQQPEPLQLHCKRAIYPMAWNRLIDTRFYKASQVSFIEGIFHEDEPWAFALVVRKPKIACVQEVTYYYRQRSGAITASERSNFPKLESMLVGFKAIAEEATAHGADTNAHFCTWFRTNIHNYLERITDGDATPKQKNELLRKLFSEVPLAWAMLKKSALFRLMRPLLCILPHRCWVGLYLRLREAKAKRN